MSLYYISEIHPRSAWYDIRDEVLGTVVTETDIVKEDAGNSAYLTISFRRPVFTPSGEHLSFIAPCKIAEIPDES